MKASVAWLNSRLSGNPRTAAEIEAILTDVGFPIDGRDDVPGGDVRLEVEVTSNRGDCLSHEHLAREIAAKTGESVRPCEVPSVTASGAPVSALLRLENRTPNVCPRFTVRVIRGVSVGPSPAWLVDKLAAVGQRSINNIVDITNYLTFEYGQPCHAFDLAKLAKGADGLPALIVRWAGDGETLTTLDGKARKLKSDELVVADAARAQSLAGVIGGGESEVSASTRDVVLEVATWDPVMVRRAARRHQVRTDASHRFERVVDARTLDAPAEHAAALIASLGRGTLAPGVLEAGAPQPPLREITLRLERIERILGIAAPAGQILARLGFETVRVVDGSIVVRVPAHRHDVTREIDLIEEVGRVHGLDRIPIGERVTIAIKGPQRSEVAMRQLGQALTGLGFYETVTFSFTSPKSAKPFLPAGLSLLGVDDTRRKEDPTLRPSVLPSLLACRKANQDGRVRQPGGVRLYETAATFAEQPVNDPARRTTTDSVRERRVLAMLIDVPGVAPGKPGTLDQRQIGIRVMRGAIEAAIRAAAGPVEVRIEPVKGAVPAYDAGAAGRVLVDGHAIGHVGLIDAAVQRQFDLDAPVVAAELELETILSRQPRPARASLLPEFPETDRDLSLIVGEGVTWGQIESAVLDARPGMLAGVAFVGVYRGKPIDAGKKSVTLRMTFRAPDRTLRDEEVNPSVEALVGALSAKLGASVRTA